VAWWPCLLLACACTLAAALLGTVLAAIGDEERANEVASVAAFAPHHDLWVRLLHGGLGRITIPFLLVVAAAALVVLARGRRWLEAAVVAAVFLGANATVQAIKHGFPRLGPTIPVLSGHMAVVIGAAFAVTVAVPAVWRRRAIAVGAVAILATGAGVVVASWHTVLEVLVPTFVAFAWVLASLPLVLRAAAPVTATDDAVPVSART
jgi:hypothetical protein